MKTFGKTLIAFAIIVILVVAGFFIYRGFWAKDTEEEPTSETVSNTSVPATKLEISQKTLANKFGFLSGGKGDADNIKENGALWVRPHPGPFLWDSMQEDKSKDYDFSKSDEMVKNYSENGLSILATLWPFAEWDQSASSSADSCKVSDSDEFLPSGADYIKRGGEYLPQHRCNPNDWDAYKKWVAAIVERYDGDGKNDMQELISPIKYWEVMNEPDLNYKNSQNADRLNFYKQGPAEYAKLLIVTSQTIKEADNEAKVLAAGAAGGDSRFLNFYRTAFSSKEAKGAFDVGNIHCISNDEYESFNVEPYKQMLEGLKISKPIWVTEAEAIISSNPSISATQQYYSTKKALELGAERIFFTNYDFVRQDNNMPPNQSQTQIKPEFDGSNPVEVYKKITAL